MTDIVRAAAEAAADEAATTIKEVTFTLDTGAYLGGDVLADTEEVPFAMRVDGGSGVLKSLTLLDKDDNAGILDVLILRTGVSIGTKNAPVSISDSDAEEVLGAVPIATADYSDLVNSQVATKGNLNIGVESADDSESLFVALVSGDTKTYTANGIVLKLVFVRD